MYIMNVPLAPGFYPSAVDGPAKVASKIKLKEVCLLLLLNKDIQLRHYLIPLNLRMFPRGNASLFLLQIILKTLQFQCWWDYYFVSTTRLGSGRTSRIILSPSKGGSRIQVFHICTGIHIYTRIFFLVWSLYLCDEMNSLTNINCENICLENHSMP